MLKLLLNICKNVLILFTRVLVVSLLILNMLFVINVSERVENLENKTTLIASAFSQYQKIIIETLTLMLRGQLATDEFIKDLQSYIYEKSASIEREIKDKTTLPNFVDLIKANVLIVNKTKGCMGSGTTIQIDGRYYILSAGHLDDPTDDFYVFEGKEKRPIILIKVNHEVDLAVFTYVNDYDDLVSANIAINYPNVGDKVWTVGNPAGLEDAITSGTLVNKKGYEYLIDAKIYYGSSGGGLFNTKGELIGVNTGIQGVCPVIIGKESYLLGVSVDLLTIKLFLLGYIINELDEG